MTIVYLLSYNLTLVISVDKEKLLTIIFKSALLLSTILLTKVILEYIILVLKEVVGCLVITNIRCSRYLVVKENVLRHISHFTLVILYLNGAIFILTQNG